MCGTKSYYRNVGEISAEFHKRNKFPTQCIGEVLISYASSLNTVNSDEGNTTQKLCLWMHPSIFDGVMQELLAVEEELQHNNDDSQSQSFSVASLGHLSRLCLRGPKSIEALKSLFNGGIICTGTHKSAVTSSFMNQLLSYKHMHRMWLPGHILSADLHFDPSSRNSSDPPASDSSVSLQWPPNSNVSPLWSEDETTSTMIKQIGSSRHKVTVRSRLLAKQQSESSSALNKGQGDLGLNSAASVPVVLIRKCAKHVDVRNRPSELSGWDVILPRAALGPVWHFLIYGGVIPLGCEEWDHLRRAVAVLSFPRDYLDSREGMQCWMVRREEHRRRNQARSMRNKREYGDVLLLLSMLQKGNEVADFKAERDQLIEYPLDRVMIVRGSHYSADFAPPFFDVAHFRATGSLPSIRPLPPLPPLTMLNVTVRMTGRGLPLDLAQLLRPLPEDYAAWLEGCERRKRRREKAGNKHESSMWRGVKLKHYAATKGCYEQRSMIGFLTSGMKPHLNNESVVIGVCAAGQLHSLFVESFGKYPHPQAHFLVLVRNVKSQWLRPALVSIM